MSNLEMITAEHGTGYICGIVGFSFMLILMIYPLRKRFNFLKFIGSVRMWFQIHMVLGIIAPVLILTHASFKLGSLNSSAALIATLSIAVSGILGRHVYCNIHYGLYGRRATLNELCDNLSELKEEITNQYDYIPGIKHELLILAKEVLNPDLSFTQSLKKVTFIGWRCSFIYWKIKFIVNSYIKNNSIKKFEKKDIKKQLKIEVRQFMLQVISVARFAFFERLFSFWQAVHIPLTYILILIVFIHIAVVNLY